jgi:predicted amidophosphoribosyltransferase
VVPGPTTTLLDTMLDALVDTLVDSFVDLVLGGRCVACARPGRALCHRCETDLPRQPLPAWPTPTPAGLAFPWAGAPYADAVRAMVVAHKERRVFALRRPLGHLLAAAAAPLATGPVVLVPVPSRPGTARARGHDPTYSLTRTAARVLRREGFSAMAARLLVSLGGVVDQAGLDAAARTANLAGSMACPSRAVRRIAGSRVRVVVCDDVLTTGATAREAQRALEAAGLLVAGIATVAATPRRLRATSSLRDSSWLPLSPFGDND